VDEKDAADVADVFVEERPRLGIFVEGLEVEVSNALTNLHFSNNLRFSLWCQHLYPPDHQLADYLSCSHSVSVRIDLDIVLVVFHLVAAVEELADVPTDAILDEEGAGRVAAHVLADIEDQVVQSAKLATLSQSPVVSRRREERQLLLWHHASISHRPVSPKRLTNNHQYRQHAQVRVVPG